MDRRVLFCFTIFIGLVLAYRKNKEENLNDTYYGDNYDYTYDDEPDKEYSVKSNKQENNIDVSTPKAATYEVTEIVNDIPNTSIRIGPVITNYSTARPLNNASVSNNSVKNITGLPALSNGNNEVSYHGSTEESNDNNKEDFIKPKKNYFSIFHVKAEYDDKPNTPQNSDSNVHKQSGFKDYILGIKKGIINGLSRIFHRKHGYDANTHEYHPDANHEVVIHKFENAANRFDHEFRHNLDNEYD